MSPSGIRTRDHLGDVENRAVPARSSHVSVGLAGRTRTCALRLPAPAGCRSPTARRGLALRDVCAARPPFVPGAARRARRPTWRGVGARIPSCDCRKMAGTIAAAIALPKNPTARRRSLSLSGGASGVSLTGVRVEHHLAGSAARGPAGRGGRWFGQQKGRPSGSPSRGSGISAALRLAHRPPDEGVLVVRQRVESTDVGHGGRPHRHAPIRPERDRRGECRARAQRVGVGVQTHEVVLVGFR
jgi:hypothetical protein